METKVIENGDAAEIILSGRLDTKTSEEADKIFTEVGSKYNDVTLNMENLNYISSAGIRTIRNLYMILYRADGQLHAKNICDNVYQVLEMTGITVILGLE
ncbi:MAG: STAS domain-containing protein [Lachnospiraceae bacterium]|nr:STAS domain-containing protein [Lachnospiraceae bacterium]